MTDQPDESVTEPVPSEGPAEDYPGDPTEDIAASENEDITTDDTDTD